MKPIIFAALLALSTLPTANGAGELDSSSNNGVALDEHLPGSDRNDDACAKENVFVLAEVRKVIESNRANKVEELSLDPDYSRDKDSYLANAVVAARAQRFSLGIIVTLQPDAKGRKTLVAFVD